MSCIYCECVWTGCVVLWCINKTHLAALNHFCCHRSLYLSVQECLFHYHTYIHLNTHQVVSPPLLSHVLCVLTSLSLCWETVEPRLGSGSVNILIEGTSPLQLWASLQPPCVLWKQITTIQSICYTCIYQLSFPFTQIWMPSLLSIWVYVLTSHNHHHNISILLADARILIKFDFWYQRWCHCLIVLHNSSLFEKNS